MFKVLPRPVFLPCLVWLSRYTSVAKQLLKETISKNNFGKNGEMVDLVLCILLDLRNCDLMLKVIFFQNAGE